MRDTEPMPVFTPPPTAPRAFFSRVASIGLPRLPLRSALAGVAITCSLVFFAWTHAEFTSLRAEVREARAAAETATRAADRATLAARAAQTALASNEQSGSSGSSNDVTDDTSQSADAPQPADTDSP